MASQVPMKSCSLRGVMASAAFSKGFHDARAGKPFDYDAYPNSDSANEQWNYERGRILGMIYKGPLKINRRVSNSALVMCSQALAEKIIL